MAVGEQVGHDKLCYASRKNRVVVVVRKDESHVHHLIERDIFIKGEFCTGFPAVSPLHEDYCARCSAIYTKQVLRERAPRVWQVSQQF